MRLDGVQAKQGGEIEDQIHDLDQREESAGEGAVRNGDVEFRMQCDRRDGRIRSWRSSSRALRAIAGSLG